jgi:Rrf2 family nitric oxide-sensitive transcriptional repressor
MRSAETYTQLAKKQYKIYIFYWRSDVRLTVYTDYALRMLMYLAVKEDGLATIADIAESYGISRTHLMKVAHQLGVAGYIETVRGRQGGLRLARPSRAINVGEVVRCTEPDMALVPCLEPVNGQCTILTCCQLRTALQRARMAFIAVLDEYTLHDLVIQGGPMRDLLGIAAPQKPSRPPVPHGMN